MPLKTHLQVTDKDNGGVVAEWTFEYEKVREDYCTSICACLDLATTFTEDSDAHLMKASHQKAKKKNGHGRGPYEGIAP